MATGNQYVQHWTKEKANEFFNDALALSEDKEYDFIGEIARDLKQYIDLFDYLIDKFPELQEVKNRILSNCAANCYSNGKRGNIVPSLAIMNLKSNHGWTDRVDQTSKNDKIEGTVINVNPIEWVDDEDS